MIAFGPVPSRRLGYSLGINHIPPKNCSYSCVYCQVGKTDICSVNRQAFYPLEEIHADVRQMINQCLNQVRKIDYLTLVPDGEPTLDTHLADMIRELKKFQIPIAVISNSSLIDREDVQQALLQADWVSLKVDSVDEAAWRKVNRPHHSVSLEAILSGIKEFRTIFSGKLVIESMLVAGVNDGEEHIHKLADFLEELQPSTAYLSLPIRPPAEKWVTPPSTETLQKILQYFAGRLNFIDLLFEAELDDFVATGNLEEDVLRISAVHPIRERALRKMVVLSGNEWQKIDNLLDSGKLICLNYQAENFYLRSRKPDKVT